MMQFMGIWFQAFLFGGFLIPDEDVVWPFRAFSYIMPLKYTVRSLVHNEFTSATYGSCDGLNISAGKFAMDRTETKCCSRSTKSSRSSAMKILVLRMLESFCSLVSYSS